MEENNKSINYRYRLTYSRNDMAAWIAHLDMMRMFQRTLKRAEIPMAYTKGYNPRPIMEFALPVGVGIETRNEPFDIVLSEEMDTQVMLDQINQNIPRGLAIVAVKKLPHNVKNIMSQVSAATYYLEAEKIGTIVEREYIKSTQPIMVEKIRKNKVRNLNIRDFLLDVQCLDENSVRIKCKAGSSDNLRPDLFIRAFYPYGISEEDALNAVICRESVELLGGNV